MEQKKFRPTPSPINRGYKVLVGVPTYSGKKYCQDEFLSRVKSLTYPNYDILIVDNSKEKDNYKELMKHKDINCLYVKPKQKHFRAVMAETHEEIRQYALRGKYDFLLHLESDIIPPNDVIERLMIHNKQIVSAVYFIQEGYRSHLMIQKTEEFGDIREMANIKDGEDLNMMDGKLHKVFGHGLGCALIHKEVLKEIPFRWSGGDLTPDSYWSFDTNASGFVKYVDTSVLCDHRNESWTNIILSNPIK